MFSEMDPINSQKGTIKVNQNLKEVLLEFTLSYLLEQPDSVIPYAATYFEQLVDKTRKSIMRESFESKRSGSVPEIEMPDDFPENFIRSRQKVVYSEPYNPELDDDDDDDEQLFYPKTDEQKEKLKGMIRKCLLFRCLERDQFMKVLDAIYERSVVPGEIIIKQGDDGDNFYIIDHGYYDVFVTEDGLQKHITVYENNGSFGELALLYNMPRQATVIAKTEGSLWVMDRATFRKIVLKGAFKKRKQYEALIEKVPMLSELNTYERMSVADALIPMFFKKGDVIIKQNDEADGMYFIEKGSATVKVLKEDKQDSIVKTLNEGAYFGELALITRHPRAATVIATSDELKLAFLDVDAFERLLGPCMDIMRRNFESYNLNLTNVFTRSTLL